MANVEQYPRNLENLIALLRRLPGIGARTAERMAMAFLEWPDEELKSLAEVLANLRSSMQLCDICGNLADGTRCRLCLDPNRQADVICVVEQASQIPVVERAGCFRGRYHVLGGRIAPLENKGPADLRIPELRRRLEDGTVRELIIATNPDMEGEATANYLAGELRRPGLAITRIAAGVPVGSDLGFADSATIAVSINARRSI